MYKFQIEGQTNPNTLRARLVVDEEGDLCMELHNGDGWSIAAYVGTGGNIDTVEPNLRALFTD